MRLSRYFMPTLREAPSDAQIVSHQLMLRAGMIRQEAAGIYAWLPLGLKVLKKIEQVVREEMDRAGAIEVLMPTLQLADLWRESGRYDDYGEEMLRIKDRHERDLLYGPTAEEVITDIFRAYIKSYKDLPKNLYNIQWKFRDERRPRFGVMRGREFLMKDAYSFDIDEAAARRAYNRMFCAYLNVYARLGLKAIPVRADTGPIGGDLSHEFIILADTGESQVFAHRDLVEMGAPGPDIDWDGDLEPLVQQRTRLYAASDEMHDQARFETEAPEDKRMTARGIEVGHIFYFGEKYSRPMNAKVAGPDGAERFVHMGSYGVGVSRLVGAIIEASHDEAGIVWPDSVAPFGAAVVNLRPGEAAVDAVAEQAYGALQAAGKEPLLDDRDERPGAKFASLDLVGVPWQLIVGPKGVAEGVVEIKRRATGERQTLPLDAALKAITA
ncbi:prolyl-tRNA synthetase [Phenylobacterium zucineum HLK1]|uniref:Proline--tRNA ligase n=1 Tax=Phenylobacterium zucineum (strain HLK1) TaxID=450851 RepID=SYP_PHEZH|nr:proline--tRNA ligase [Phenylobacterium zucineum]B4RBZ9.1 RecName: Full=Proline--tRNA ligase; AltName: Full=Prolyl-tRNA synthetase; Short=ProRS [Phenylobacterium zucineum HLK1]ACG78196.1 prolyl-tRNA synthetase [Phenylobacterium zucineum HLK1]